MEELSIQEKNSRLNQDSNPGPGEDCSLKLTTPDLPDG